MAAALEDITVLDLSRVLAGPYATMLLGDLGADVIKVERPDGGDDTRAWGPPFAGADAAYFHAVNRNKRSVILDLRTAGDRQQLRRLAATADVVVHNFQPEVAARLGADEAQLGHPRLVYCAISSFGAGGEDSDRPGYDLLVQAMGGLMSITGAPDGPPTKVGVAMVDVVTGLFAVQGILAALRVRDRTGRGQRVDLSLQDCLASALVNQAQNYLVQGEPPSRMGNAHPNLVPYEAFPAADGWLVVAAGNDAMFRRLAAAVGREAWADDSRFATNAARVTHREPLVAALRDVFAREGVETWVAKLTDAGVPAGPIRDVGALLDSAHLRSRGMIVEVDHPDAGPMSLVRNPVFLSATPPRVRRPPPRLGEHDDEVKSGSR
ncbi:MAG: CoA transferase [Myxococcota bacterium]